MNILLECHSIEPMPPSRPNSQTIKLHQITHHRNVKKRYVKENGEKILDPHQTCSILPPRLIVIRYRTVLTNKKNNKQRDRGENITSLAEVNIT